MYKLLMPWRSLGRNLYRYLIFGLLLVLLFTLNFSVRIIGEAAQTESDAIVKQYSATLMCYDLMEPHGEASFYEEILPSLPHVEHIEIRALHCLNSVLGTWMIGSDPVSLEASPIEGRMYENDTECVINESYAEYLRINMGFAGIGDTITAFDYDNERQYKKKLQGAGNLLVFYSRPMSREFTVVGILSDDATVYNQTQYFGNYRIFTGVDAVSSFYEGIEDNLYDSKNGSVQATNHVYPSAVAASEFWLSVNQRAMQPSEDETHWIFLDKYTGEKRILADYELSLSQYPPTEGYVALVTVDFPENAEQFRTAVCGAYEGFTSTTLAQMEAGAFKDWQTLTVDGVESTWYGRLVCQQLWYAAYLIDDPETLVESLAPIVPLCETIASASSIASAVLILLMTILIVYERRYEIGVLRCIGVSSGGVCARFIGEIVVFLIIVSAIGIGVGIPAARFAADAMSLGESVGELAPTALLMLGGIGAVTAASCLIAAAMILSKKPMQILNSRT